MKSKVNDYLNNCQDLPTRHLWPGNPPQQDVHCCFPLFFASLSSCIGHNKIYVDHYILNKSPLIEITPITSYFDHSHSYE